MSDYFLGHNWENDEKWFSRVMWFCLKLVVVGIILLSLWFTYTLNRDQALKNCTGSVEYCNKMSR